MDSYITAGELARLAGTTKRTILWYDHLGILEPAYISPEGYRYYTEAQVLEYQMVLLMTTLGVSLTEIKGFLSLHHNLADLFTTEKKAIKTRISELVFTLSQLEIYTKNLHETKTLINPVIKELQPFDVYYIEKVGPYASIGRYCDELASMFSKKGKNFTTMAIFENQTYQPKKSLIKIAALANDDMRVKPNYKDIAKRLTFSPGKVITYTHNGKGELLSLFWKELEKYCRLNTIEVRKDVPDFEIYRKVNSNPQKQFFEIYLPIK